jgi:hypothetical protein
MIRVATCVAILCLSSLTATAGPSKAKLGPQGKIAAAPSQIAATPKSTLRQHSLFVELFGKSGLYGIGYDYRLKRRVGVGVVASAYKIEGERTLSLSPYVTLYPLLHGHHGWFAQAGPLIVSTKLKSPLPVLDRDFSTSLAAQVSSGYEYKNRLLIRAFVMGVGGSDGISPWAGMSLGFTF